MLYSSGTTGQPKGIERPLSGKQIDDPSAATMATMLRTLLGMDEHSVYLCPAPLYHSAGLSWSSGTHELGGTVVVMEKFDAEQFLALVETRGRHPHAGRPHHAGSPYETACSRSGNATTIRACSVSSMRPPPAL